MDLDSLIATVRHDPNSGIPRLQLGFLAEKRRDWYEAVYWFEEFLKIDSQSQLAANVRRELTYLNEITIVERSPRGSEHRRSLDLLTEAQGELANRNWVAAGAKAYQALFADPGNYQAHLVAATAAEHIERFDLAEMILVNAKLHAPKDFKLRSTKPSCDARA